MTDLLMWQSKHPKRNPDGAKRHPGIPDFAGRATQRDQGMSTTENDRHQGGEQ
jgi:hypothetical protein